MVKIKKIIKLIKKYKKDNSFRAKFRYTKYYEKLKINDNIILIESFLGKNYNGTIYYLLKELCSNPEYAKYKKYLAVQPKFIPDLQRVVERLNIKNAEIIIKYSDTYCKVLATAKYLINNCTFPEFFIKREGQIYLNTWHGAAVKAVGKEIKSTPHIIGNIQRNFLMSDYLLCTSRDIYYKFWKDHMLEQFFTGKYLFAGDPCNEAFFYEDEKEELRKKLGITNKKVIAYMPTWREVKSKKETNKHMTYLMHVLYSFEDKLEDDTVVYVKLHHLATGNIDFSVFKKVRPFPKEYETYQFLNLADGFISDYSCATMEFANTGRKIMLYIYDRKEYENGRSMNLNLDELPFPKSDNVDDIIKEIKNINDYKDYTEEVKNKFCEFDNKYASKILCDFVFKGIQSEKIQIIDGNTLKNNKKNVLIFGGGLTKNGLTTALKGLIDNIDLEKHNYFLTFYKKDLDGNVEILNELKRKIDYFPIQGAKNLTICEAIIQFLYFRLNINSKLIQKKMKNIYEREVKRIFPYMKFDYVIHYTGYEKNFMHIFANMDATKIIYTHRDMLKESKTRNNVHINSLKMAYKKFDKIVTIREGMDNAIKEHIKKVDEKNIFLAHNINNIEEIKQKSLKNIEFDEDTYCNYSIEELKQILEDENSIKFINISRYSKEKGLERLISAFNKFNSKNENSYLIIIGGHGGEFKKIKDMVEKNNLSNIVIIRSLRNPFSILRRCNAFVLSSYYEGLPMVIMEALILKKPVICTNITGPRAFLEQGYGYLVEDSEEGILEGFYKFKNGELNGLKKFDAEEFNKKALQEFYEVIK